MKFSHALIGVVGWGILGAGLAGAASTGLQVSTPLTPSECTTFLDYAKPMQNDAASFVLRSGYSRDNDDPKEGNYETAIFDLELVGKSLPNGKTCLHLVVTPILLTEIKNAEGWAKTFFLRPLSVHQSVNGKWEPIGGARRNGFPFSVVKFDRPPYLASGKLAKADRPANERVGLRAVAYLGIFDDGSYTGRTFLQKENGGFSNVDHSDYDSVRHVLDWTLSLQNGQPVNPTKVTDRQPVHFPNEVYFVTPKWHNTLVLEDGKWGIKQHSVMLLWKDVVLVAKAPKPHYGTYNLLDTLQGVLNADASAASMSPIGRLPIKRH